METYDKLLSNMMDRPSASGNPDNAQRTIDQLIKEIDALNEEARLKELEWNNILYLKRMKEDMLLRLNRKKTVMEIMSMKIFDEPENILNTIKNYHNNNNNSSAANLSDEVTIVDCNGTFPRKDFLNAIAGNTSIGNSRCSDIAKERSNMNSSDLAKEKANISKIYR